MVPLQYGAAPPKGDGAAVLTMLTWAVSVAARPTGGNWGEGGALAVVEVATCPNAETVTSKSPAQNAREHL
jgi:hypothetical protein